MSCCSLVNTNRSRSFEKVPLLNYGMEILRDFDFTRSFSGWFDSAGSLTHFNKLSRSTGSVELIARSAATHDKTGQKSSRLLLQTGSTSKHYCFPTSAVPRRTRRPSKVKVGGCRRSNDTVFILFSSN
ncbi:hypothetical protein T05_11804 [Trichinella murrelli]|uniref:Uncharacterized protein n=1 Tax=Trichinella murrelli TaxID=144512 RepID=A0A0V0UDY4_9BILA|nr:hypothetical protein T05_11804 [Trichinella murrelli]